MIFENVKNGDRSDRQIMGEQGESGRPEAVRAALRKAGSAYTAKRGKRLNRIGLRCDSGGEARANWFQFCGARTIAPLFQRGSPIYASRLCRHYTIYQNAAPGP